MLRGNSEPMFGHRLLVDWVHSLESLWAFGKIIANWVRNLYAVFVDDNSFGHLDLKPGKGIVEGIIVHF